MDGRFDVNFSKETEQRAIVLVAFDIMKQARNMGLITEEELVYLAKKHHIRLETK